MATERSVKFIIFVSQAGVLKLYFRELKEPLFSRDMFDSFIGCIGKKKFVIFQLKYFLSIFIYLVDVESEEKCVENFCQVVKLLPRPIFIVMRYFFAFLISLVSLSGILT